MQFYLNNLTLRVLNITEDKQRTKLFYLSVGDDSMASDPSDLYDAPSWALSKPVKTLYLDVFKAV